MSISVVIPVKDDPSGLSRTLDSLPRTVELQIIVIDGESASATRAVIDANEARLDYWESGLDSGIADAMNRGLARATGNHVAILNAGDTWLPETLGRVRHAIAMHPGADVYHGTIEYVSPQGGVCHRVEPQVRRLPERMFVFHPTMFVARDCYRDIGGYDTGYAYAMDSEWCHRALAAGRSFHTIDAPLARMALGGRSDVNYRDALREFRRSVMHHGLATRTQAYRSYATSLTGKWINNTPLLGHLARSLLRSSMARSH